MDEIEKRHFEDATQALEGAERELIAAMQNFIDAQAKAGKSKGHALDILPALAEGARGKSKAVSCGLQNRWA
jgi:hypothetical protein